MYPVNGDRRLQSSWCGKERLVLVAHGFGTAVQEVCSFFLEEREGRRGLFWRAEVGLVVMVVTDLLYTTGEQVKE